MYTSSSMNISIVYIAENVMTWNYPALKTTRYNYAYKYNTDHEFCI